jgi:hypothetical protein
VVFPSGCHAARCVGLGFGGEYDLHQLLAPIIQPDSEQQHHNRQTTN